MFGDNIWALVPRTPTEQLQLGSSLAIRSDGRFLFLTIRSHHIFQCICIWFAYGHYIFNV